MLKCDALSSVPNQHISNSLRRTSRSNGSKLFRHLLLPEFHQDGLKFTNHFATSHTAQALPGCEVDII